MNELPFDLSDIHCHYGECSILGKTITLPDIYRLIDRVKYRNIVITPLDLALKSCNLELDQVLDKPINIFAFPRVSFTQPDSFSSANKILDKYRHAIGIKFHPTFDNIAVDDQKYDSLFKKLNDHNLIALIHCGRTHPASKSESVINRASQTEYARVTYIMAHMGGNALDISLDTIKKIQEHDHIYLDTSNCRTPHIIEEAVSKLGCRRIFFGSDYPWGSPYSNAYTVIDADISDDAKKCILSRNLEQLLSRYL